MSLIPRRERTDAERRRLARNLGLRPSASWPEVDCALIDWRSFRRLAESYGLEEDATWDDIYAAFRRRYDRKWATIWATITAAYYAAIPGAILLLVWMHWITITIALVAFVAIFAIFVIIDSVKGLKAGEVRRGMCDSFPEFKKRAERDGDI
jgi:hypothetical protein